MILLTTKDTGYGIKMFVRSLVKMDKVVIVDDTSPEYRLWLEGLGANVYEGFDAGFASALIYGYTLSSQFMESLVFQICGMLLKELYFMM